MAKRTRGLNGRALKSKDARYSALGTGIGYRHGLPVWVPSCHEMPIRALENHHKEPSTCPNPIPRSSNEA